MTTRFVSFQAVFYLVESEVWMWNPRTVEGEPDEEMCTCIREGSSSAFSSDSVYANTSMESSSAQPGYEEKGRDVG